MIDTHKILETGQIDTENWTYRRYKGPDSFAFISMGAEPRENQEPEILYFVTLTNFDYEEIFQRPFRSLDLALSYLNKTYSKWSLVEAGGKTDGDGCSSCAAH